MESLRTYRQPVMVYMPPGSELRGGAWVVIDGQINAQQVDTALLALGDIHMSSEAPPLPSASLKPISLAGPGGFACTHCLAQSW